MSNSEQWKLDGKCNLCRKKHIVLNNVKLVKTQQRDLLKEQLQRQWMKRLEVRIHILCRLLNMERGIRNMKLYIYDRDRKKIKEISNVKPHGFKTMLLGIPARQVLMFKHEHGDGSIDLVNGMTFALYDERKGKVYG